MPLEPRCHQTGGVAAGQTRPIQQAARLWEQPLHLVHLCTTAEGVHPGEDM